jgi:hypothetical protein
MENKNKKLDRKLYKNENIKPKVETISDSASQGNFPKKKFRAGAISATVWENKGTTTQGDEKTYNTISLERVYQDKEGNWKSTNSFRLSDLPKAQAVLMRVFNDLTVKEQDLFASKM